MAMTNLPPQPTSFIGREHEISQITALLDTPACRLLTLVGPGGIGKTRLALEVASRMMTHFADGVYFVPLQPLRDVEDIVTTIIEALPLQLRDVAEPRSLLLNYLREKQLLLLLDNFEHLLDGVDLVTDIFGTATQVRLMVTSREWLNVQAEQVWPMRGLDVPEDTVDMPELHSAVQLFVERARRVQPEFSFDVYRDAVIRICRLVDGMPLALELAASWVRAMPIETIADEIRHNIDILTTNQRDRPERHRSMRAVFDHSWRLLTHEERTALPKLAVFRGGFTADAAKQVAGASLPILGLLIDRSLVQKDEQGRYTLHELLRQYVEEGLAASDRVEIACNAHSAFYGEFLFNRVEDLKGHRQLAAIAEISVDFENVRAAWYWATDLHHAEIIEQMIEGLWVFCELANREPEGYALYRYAEQRFAPARSDPQSLWRLLLARAATGETLQTELETALHLAQRLNDSGEVAFCLARLGWAAHRRGENRRAKQWLLQSLTISRQLDDHFAASGVLFWLLTTWDGESWEEFRQYGEEALCRSRAIGDQFGIARSLSVAATDAGRSGRFEEAERLWFERVTLGKEVNNIEMVGGAYTLLSERVYFIQGKFERARAAAEETIRLANILGHKALTAHALVTLGLIASVNGDYAEGISLCKQATSLTWDASTSRFAAWGIALASCGLGDFETAQKSLRTTYSYLSGMLGQVGLVGSLPIIATSLAHQGNHVRAVELLALAFTHPIRASGWMEKWALLDRLQVELEGKLGSEAYATAWQRGRHLNLEYLVNQLFSDLQAAFDDAARLANQALIEPLTERELEVLALMAVGLSNPQIAERLFITKGTTRGHINKIYRKLGTSNRVEAILHAQALHLV